MEADWSDELPDAGKIPDIISRVLSIVGFIKILLTSAFLLVFFGVLAYLFVQFWMNNRNARLGILLFFGSIALIVALAIAGYLVAKRHSGKPGNNYIGPILGVALSIAFLSVGVIVTAQGISTYSWDEAAGKILSSDVVSKTKHENGRTSTLYSASVRYEYLVDGKSYTGSRIGVVSSSSSFRSWAEKTASRYSEDSNVPVYFNPKEPSSSVLAKGPSVMVVVITLVVAGGICIPCVYRIVKLRRR